MTEKNRYLLGVQSAKKETNPVFSKKNEKLHWLYKNSQKKHLLVEKKSVTY